MENQKGNLLSAFDKAHGTFTKFVSAKGYLLTAAIIPTMAVMASTPSLIGVATQFYSFALSSITENFIPGWGIVLSAGADAALTFGELVLDAV